MPRELHTLKSRAHAFCYQNPGSRSAPSYTAYSPTRTSTFSSCTSAQRRIVDQAQEQNPTPVQLCARADSISYAVSFLHVLSRTLVVHAVFHLYRRSADHYLLPSYRGSQHLFYGRHDSRGFQSETTSSEPRTLSRSSGACDTALAAIASQEAGLGRRTSLTDPAAAAL